jgi:hypothetical protein
LKNVLIVVDDLIRENVVVQSSDGRRSGHGDNWEQVRAGFDVDALELVGVELSMQQCLDGARLGLGENVVNIDDVGEDIFGHQCPHRLTDRRLEGLASANDAREVEEIKEDDDGLGHARGAEEVLQKRWGCHGGG